VTRGEAPAWADALDAVLFDIGGTLVDEAPPATATTELVVTLLPDVLDDLRFVQRHVKVGAVTNTAVMTEADVRALLEPSGVSALLEVLVTSVDAGVAKPDPRPIQLALDALGLDEPARVLYVGNTPSDEAAATAAGVHYADIAAGTVRAVLEAWHRPSVPDTDAERRPAP
jgi:FMN phosphatase YigB (HAD superfamily)